VRLAAFVAIAVVLWSFCAAAQFVSSTGGGAAGNGIDIRGTGLVRNGQAWVPKGVSTIAFIVTNAQAAGGGATAAQQRAARAAFGAPLLNLMHSRFGADTVRFQLAQVGLDPLNGSYDAAYAGQITTGVNLALSMGFAVILTIDADAFSGGSSTMPDAGTVRAWQTIGPSFANNRNVMFEVFNEPQEVNSAGARTDWVNGMAPAIAAIRALPANNILVLDGLQFARDLRNMSLTGLGDTYAGRAIFGVHPYFMPGYVDATTWDAWFGSGAQASNPVMISEWSFNAAGCLTGDGSTVNALLAYVKSKHFGMTYWAIDYTPTLTQDVVSYPPTVMDNFTACGDGSGAGAGALFAAFTP